MTGTVGTRWGRASGALLVGLALVAVAASMVWNRAFGLDARIIIQNQPMSFSTGKLVANDVGFGMTAVQQQDGAWKNVLRAGFATARMNGLCVSQTSTLVGGLVVTVKLTAGDGQASTNEIEASNAAFDLSQLRASGAGIELQGTAQMGLATTDITTVPGAAPYLANPLGDGTPNQFLNSYIEGVYAPSSAGLNGGNMNGQGWTGVDATQGTLTTIRGTLHQAQISGAVVLPQLKIEVLPGTAQSCEAAAAAGSYPG